LVKPTKKVTLGDSVFSNEKKWYARQSVRELGGNQPTGNEAGR